MLFSTRSEKILVLFIGNLLFNQNTKYCTRTQGIMTTDKFNIFNSIKKYYVFISRYCKHCIGLE